ncbi:MAG: glycosyltransferase [Nevskiaceae bacterium]|nr:MAG: glycosyltransferase [Nevskiaceae bacterium]TBR74173.1 MAG: glycosyltransferase [Nevskiaceae bacterium]
MYKEEENVAPMLAAVHAGLRDYGGPWELVCVDDGSPDATGARLLAAAQDYGSHVHVIRFARNQGQTPAMQAGIDAARGALIATLDGDLQNDPGDIPRMVDELRARDLDLLQGRRAHRQDAMISRKLPSRIANKLIAKVTGVALHDYGCSLKVYRADIIKRVRLYGEMHRFIPVWAAMVTAPSRIGETDVKHRAREFGESKYGISRTFRVILDLLTVFFFLRYRKRPGHFFGSIGLIFGALGSLAMAWLLFAKFVMGENIGDRPLFLTAILLLVFAIQFLTTGVVAEMLVRLFDQHRERPAVIAELPASTATCLPADGWKLDAPAVQPVPDSARVG